MASLEEKAKYIAEIRTDETDFETMRDFYYEDQVFLIMENMTYAEINSEYAKLMLEKNK